MKSYSPKRYDLFFNENNFRSGFSQNIIEYMKNNIEKTEIKKEKFKNMFIKNFFLKKTISFFYFFFKKLKNFQTNILINYMIMEQTIIISITFFFSNSKTI